MTKGEQIEVECERCDGRGWVRGKRTCNVCRGNGEVGGVRCPICKGSGEVDGQETCTECKGKGKVTI